MSSRFRVNAPHVINEVIEGEAVIINLTSGDYFSLRGSGSYIWQALDAGADPAAIADAFAAAGLHERAEVEAAVRGLVAELLAEGLVVAIDDPQPGPEAATTLAAPDAVAYEPPALEKYTDMQDLILLDPVHEVDERGWPHAAPQR